jgi:sugar phosphate isomerase/epimerase
VIGDGQMKWKEFFEICETTGGTEWYIIEHETPGLAPLEAVKLCLEAMKKMGK